MHRHDDMNTVFKMADGTSKRIFLTPKFKSTYRDEYTEEIIPRAWVEHAIKEELD